MTDEEILFKATLLLEQIGQELLTEITEEEKQVVNDVLARIKENPTGILAFDDIFGDKLRLVIDFPVKDTKSELGKFVNQLEQTFKLNVDWDKGIVSAEREWQDHVEGEESKGRIKKKFQMKIGKYLAKLDDLVKKYKKIVQESAALGSFEAPPDQEVKRNRQILNQLELYLGSVKTEVLTKLILAPADQKNWEAKEQARRDLQDKGDIDHGKEPRKRKPIVVPETKFIDMGSYWLNNAKYIKDNISTLEGGRYSMIISRHPVDMLRMSDFEKIHSCHTPMSAGGNQPQYFKCAGAEAQGHGAISFVVNTENLLSQTNTSNIDSAQQELEEYDEIFQDQKRKFGVGDNLGLDDPLSRVRLRQFRYFRDSDEKNEPLEGTELAVPEEAIYGEEIAGISDRVRRWVRSKQEDALSSMPKKDGKINLDNFEIYGGSYEDTPKPPGRKLLLSLLTELPQGDFTGDVTQNTETEDKLPMPGESIQDIQFEINLTANHWNGRYAACNVEGEARDTYYEEDAIEIGLKAVIKIEWELDEWVKLPNYENMVDCIGYLIDGGYGNIPNLNEKEALERRRASGERINRYSSNSYVAHSNSYLSDDGYIGKLTNARDREVITVIIPIDQERLIGWEKPTAIHNMGEDYSFDRFCQILDLVDDVRDNIQAGIEKYFKMEGYISGGIFQNWAREIANSSGGPYYEWHAAAVEGDEHEEYDKITVETNDTYIDMSEFVEKDKYNIKWSRISGQLAAYINNNPVARVYRADEGGYEIADSPVDGFYDSFEAVKSVLDAAFTAEEYAYDVIKQVLNSREFSIDLKLAMVEPYLEESGGKYPPNWGVSAKMLPQEEGVFDIEIKMIAYGDEPDSVVQIMKTICEEWDEESFLRAIVMEVARERMRKVSGTAIARGRMDENKQYNTNYLVKTWKRFIL